MNIAPDHELRKTGRCFLGRITRRNHLAMAQDCRRMAEALHLFKPVRNIED